MKTNPLEIEFFGKIDKNFEKEFYSCAKTIKYRKGDSPFSVDNLLSYFYIVLDGRIKTYQLNFENAKEQILFIYKRGDMFDVVSLLDGKAHEVIYEVMEDCRVLQFPVQKIREWLESDLAFKNMFYTYLASSIRYTENLAVELSLYEVKDRLMNLLLENLNPNARFRYKVLHNLSNSEISNMLGTVRHVVERAIKQLKDEKIIKSGRKNITVINVHKLLEKSTKMLHK
ncbi:cyclic nucleotide-binding domain (cNMP-BD) protein [Sulfurimonas denitrificans DSM 1251]|uniref:Cyclic nucleotide-binding domain (CNMP-BD) protein n=1 Tax=Sulfurimonas denitrificans (strain ATCC 33889 / DSM 1251) TaxID=326298 RepID=Q30T89_SULDN|nr:Crp/Fnr family transcriptional regulator [Sulfurimonas denitrificans]ABB43792.1 cyclic nucleotide-binding domain (cNMP-BD) protein [Sulfurimonas denitrificans DSM 1251]MDD3442463.1 Crp/Fnr family transcriptional regulator [Sulfurimonas denitrificans]